MGTTAEPTVEDLLKDGKTKDAAGASDQEGKDKGKEGEEKLFAGKYKTVEELEKAYGNSNTEASKIAQELADLKKANEDPSKGKDGKEDEVSLEDLKASYKEDPVKTVLWMLKNIGREQTAEIVKASLEQRDTDIDDNTTRRDLRREYPDLINKESKLYLEAAKEYSRFPKMSKADPAGALRLAAERAAGTLGISKAQRDESQRRSDVEANAVESSQGRGEGGKLALNDEEKVIAKNLGISEEEYLNGLGAQGGRRVRVSGGGKR